MDFSFTFLSVALLAIQSCQCDGICKDVTVASCDFGNENLIDSLYTLDTFICQDICHTFTSCYFFRFNETAVEDNCKLFKSNYRESCEIVSAPVHRDVNECFNSIEATCTKFMEESCDFFGAEIYVAPPGSIADSNSCDELCADFERMGCTYWKFKKENNECFLYDSSERTCDIISGPEKPNLESCLDNYSTTTSSEKTTTDFDQTSTTPALTTASFKCYKDHDCDVSYEYCDLTDHSCKSFSGYNYYDNTFCVGNKTNEVYTLERAIAGCNHDKSCSCFYSYDGTTKHFLYEGTITSSDWSGYEAWVKT